MILYFSATGNCEYIAQKIADELGDRAVSLTVVQGEIELNRGESLGIITPTYYWGLPSYVDDKLASLTFENTQDSYIYCIATYGTTSGQVDYFISEHLKRKGLSLNASFSIKTVDNWTVLFDVSDLAKVRSTLIEESKQIEAIIPKIAQKKREFIQKDKKALWLCKMAKRYYKKARKTSHLHVLDSCTGCGLCEKDCPLQAIKLRDGKPQWIKEHCTMCFRCLHSCPTFSIQYNDKTQNHGQYRHPKYHK